MIHLTTILSFLIYDHLCIPCFVDYFFFLIYANNFEIVYTCVSIQNTNTDEVLGDSHKYFIFLSHICSFTSIIFKNSLFGSIICFYCHNTFLL